jgi:flagellar biosynthesis/type III secretory pathway protein FliH
VIGLVLAVLLAAPELQPCTAEDPCDMHDGPRLIVTVVNEKARADKAEKIADLEKAARESAERLVQNEHQRAEDWKTTAQKAAYRAWYEQPIVLYGGGIATGILLTVAIVAVAH